MRYMENNNVTILQLYSGEMIIGTEDSSGREFG